MAGKNLDVGIAVKVSTDGEEKLSGLARELDGLASGAGNATPQFDSLANAQSSLAKSAGEVAQRTGELRPGLQGVGSASDTAAGKVSGLGGIADEAAGKLKAWRLRSAWSKCCRRRPAWRRCALAWLRCRAMRKRPRPIWTS